MYIHIHTSIESLMLVMYLYVCVLKYSEIIIYVFVITIIVPGVYSYYFLIKAVDTAV